MRNVTAQEFYNAWHETVSSKRDSLTSIWRNNSQLTAMIKGTKDSIIQGVADKLGLECYQADYYSLDTVLFDSQGKTPGTPVNSTWLRDIRVAFEHENNFKGGLYQEVSHLLITNCDLKVLVTYPIHSSSNEQTKNEMRYLHDIINGSRQAERLSNEESFLLIFGYEQQFKWEGFVFKKADWTQIKVLQSHTLAQ